MRLTKVQLVQHRRGKDRDRNKIITNYICMYTCLSIIYRPNSDNMACCLESSCTGPPCKFRPHFKLCFGLSQIKHPSEHSVFSSWGGEQGVDSALKKESSKIMTIKAVENSQKVIIWQRKNDVKAERKSLRARCLFAFPDAKQLTWESLVHRNWGVGLLSENVTDTVRLPVEFKRP